jgi:tRNA G18 (ribose-2'-O)-methylase SpoU
LVLGGERSGNAAVAIPMLGVANSVDVATAAAILLYWVVMRFEEIWGS